MRYFGAVWACAVVSAGALSGVTTQVKVEHYAAVHAAGALRPGDMVFIFSVRPNTGHGPGTFDLARYTEKKGWLDAIEDPTIVKGLTLSSYADLQYLVDHKLLPRELVWVTYDTEPGMTPAEEFLGAKYGASLAKFAAIAHGAGLKVIWGPMLHQMNQYEELYFGPGGYATLVDSVQLQHQKLIQPGDAASVELYISETRRRAAMIHANTRAGYRVSAQVVIGMGSREQTVRALQGVAGDVENLGLWTMRDTEGVVEVLERVRVAGGQ